MKPSVTQIIAAVVLMWASISNAMPILQGTPDAALGFKNIEIGGVLYDLTFNGNDFIFDVYPTTPRFSGDPSGAEEASIALAQAMTVNNVIGISDFDASAAGGIVLAGFPYEAYLLFGRTHLRSFIVEPDVDTGVWSSLLYDLPRGISVAGLFYSIASLEEVGAPVPAPAPISFVVFACLYFFQRKPNG